MTDQLVYIQGRNTYIQNRNTLKVHRLDVAGRPRGDCQVDMIRRAHHDEELREPEALLAAFSGHAHYGCWPAAEIAETLRRTR